LPDKFLGKRFNSRSDVVVHGDGSIWFTDPPYGIRGNHEGFKGESKTKPGSLSRRSEERPDRHGERRAAGPNGLCFSRDYTRLYVADTGTGRDIRVWDVDGERLRNLRRHAQLTVPGRRKSSSVPATSSLSGTRCIRGRTKGPSRSRCSS
jgi:gluconolactonase